MFNENIGLTRITLVPQKISLKLISFTTLLKRSTMRKAESNFSLVLIQESPRSKVVHVNSQCLKYGRQVKLKTFFPTVEIFV